MFNLWVEQAETTGFGTMERRMSVSVLLPGLLPLAFAAGFWARWLHQRRDRVPAVTRYVPAAMVTVVLAALAVTAWGLLEAHHGISGGEPADRAGRLAGGISLALNATAAAYCVVVLTLIALLAGT